MFETTDPLGRKVKLETKTWNIHIVPSHNELYKQDALVKKTIEDPKFILVDKDSQSRQNYFDLCNIPKDNSLSILKVVVDFTNSTGDVMTAYTIKSTPTQATTKRGVIYERP